MLPPNRIVGLFARPRRLFDRISPLGALRRQIAVYSLAQYPCDGDIMLARYFPHLPELRFGQNDRCPELFLAGPGRHGPASRYGFRIICKMHHLCHYDI